MRNILLQLLPGVQQKLPDRSQPDPAYVSAPAAEPTDSTADLGASSLTLLNPNSSEDIKDSQDSTETAMEVSSMFSLNSLEISQEKPLATSTTVFEGVYVLFVCMDR